MSFNFGVILCYLFLCLIFCVYLNSGQVMGPPKSSKLELARQIFVNPSGPEVSPIRGKTNEKLTLFPDTREPLDSQDDIDPPYSATFQKPPVSPYERASRYRYPGQRGNPFERVDVNFGTNFGRGIINTKCIIMYVNIFFFLLIIYYNKIASYPGTLKS